ncbi:hypothetical protein [Sphingomonas crocodyli]|uniref:Uncharacterized protein n=1 Tax=Sphingomonas crocodyli TaxID=1979270 RepID=A0A437LYN2_9SPHN|nr:hypothetical protein [Sphingomonas crocodyli]RVT90433.1 hypothetical protein EOD43_19440 [Sphingomonas crocodyli]
MKEAGSTSPDGISDQHIEASHWVQRHANPTSLIVIALLLASTWLGILGGRPNPVSVVETGEAQLTIKSPATLRNGTFYETRITIEPKISIKQLTLAISPALWRDITINSGIPAAEKEEFKNGMFRMSFGPAEAGKPVEIKFDGQVNPPLVGRNSGSIAILDGEVEIVRTNLSMLVLP